MKTKRKMKSVAKETEAIKHRMKKKTQAGRGGKGDELK